MTPSVQWGYLTRAVKEIYPHLAELPYNDEKLLKTVAVARRAFEYQKRKREEEGDACATSTAATSKQKFREPGENIMLLGITIAITIIIQLFYYLYKVYICACMRVLHVTITKIQFWVILKEYILKRTRTDKKDI